MGRLQLPRAAQMAARGFNRRLCQEGASPLATGPKRIAMYDTTLRDGTQGEGVSLSLHDKLLIAERLDDMLASKIEKLMSLRGNVQSFRKQLAAEERASKAVKSGSLRF